MLRAATIHKSQGCTLSCAELILTNTFTYGQAYVALSRVRDLKGLWLSAPIKRKYVIAHPDVLSFYKSMESSQAAPTSFDLANAKPNTDDSPKNVATDPVSAQRRSVDTIQ